MKGLRYRLEFELDSVGNSVSLKEEQNVTGIHSYVYNPLEDWGVGIMLCISTEKIKTLSSSQIFPLSGFVCLACT